MLVIPHQGARLHGDEDDARVRVPTGGTQRVKGDRRRDNWVPSGSRGSYWNESSLTRGFERTRSPSATVTATLPTRTSGLSIGDRGLGFGDSAALGLGRALVGTVVWLPGGELTGAAADEHADNDTATSIEARQRNKVISSDVQGCGESPQCRLFDASRKGLFRGRRRNTGDERNLEPLDVHGHDAGRSLVAGDGWELPPRRADPPVFGS